MGRGKLIDDPRLAQFDSLVKVLSFPSSEKDFRHLLMLSSLQEVLDHSEEFVLLKVPLVELRGSSEVQAREWVLSRLLARIKEASEEMVGGDVVTP